MKKFLSLFLALCLCIAICSCSDQTGNSTDQTSKTLDVNDMQETVDTQEIIKIPCAESGCKSWAENSEYCDFHLKTYENEREYYYDIQSVLKKLSSAYGYSATKKYEVKEVVVDYAEISRNGETKGLKSYINIYVYFTLGLQNGFIEYGVLDRQFGLSPQIEFISEDMYNMRRRQALGGDSFYNRSFRDNHCYRNTTDYISIGTFILNFEDYIANDYSY